MSDERALPMTRVYRTCLIYLPIVFVLGSVARAVSPDDSIAAFGKQFLGHYDNAEQVAAGMKTTGDHPPQHVTVTVQSTNNPDWQLWHIHMDVDAATAKKAGAATKLDALWAMQVKRTADGGSLELMPYTFKTPSNEDQVKASSFDASQWRPVTGCGLQVQSMPPRLVAMTPTNERCFAEVLTLGGKGAFLPGWVERKDNMLGVQLMYFGSPWRVMAKRVTAAGASPN